MKVEAGKDIKGTINGESATGLGQVLTGIEGAKCVDGLSIRYYGDGKDFLLPEECEVSDIEGEGKTQDGTANQAAIPPEGMVVGRVFVAQNSMRFQLGGNTASSVKISISNMKPDNLSRFVPNISGFESLDDIDVTAYQKAHDSLLLVE